MMKGIFVCMLLVGCSLVGALRQQASTRILLRSSDGSIERWCKTLCPNSPFKECFKYCNEGQTAGRNCEDECVASPNDTLPFDKCKQRCYTGDSTKICETECSSSSAPACTKHCYAGGLQKCEEDCNAKSGGLPKCRHHCKAHGRCDMCKSDCACHKEIK
uniref:Uncharacterized protein n=1 Tax=Mucochytrium quahogii TaxID=96639 RepID=A0A7S2RBS7_9STRA|mmetsp:Transcript_12461/g.19823  ORF Transcript_12461/g.19823 Transcript_12461/m.19823 type:complete len:160 (+) Transcript_12461:78-557(+)